jgi:hypothetical protein
MKRPLLYFLPVPAFTNRHKNIIKGDKELEELFSLVSSMSWVRHAVLSYFQRFKLENRELIQKELEKDPASSPGDV